MQQCYQDYKYLVDYDIWHAIREIALNNGESVCHQIANNLYKRDLPLAITIKPNSVELVKQLVAEESKKLGLQSWQVDVVTQNVSFYHESKDPVYVLDGIGSKVELHDISTTMTKLSNQIDSVPFLYIDKTKYELIERTIIKKCRKDDAFIY